MVSIHALLARGPFAWANFSVLLVVLEGLNKSEDLINVSTYGQVVVLHVSKDTLAIDDESGSKVESIISGEATIVATELLGQVSEHGDLHTTKTTLITWLVGELHMSEV